jgi:ribosomal protein S18 acetylase RimI-like enzyme
MQIELPNGIRVAQPDDWRQMGSITAEAFEDDPVNRWLVGNPRALTSIFTVLARNAYLKTGICHIAGDKGATMWRKVDGSHETVSLLSMVQIATGVLIHGTRGSVRRAIKAGDAMDANHPKEPHMYLFTIGTRKGARGQGIGKALIRPMLEACDREGLPAYLENSNPANTGFYVSHGFERMKLFEVGPGSPQLEAMWRKPKSL